MISCNDVTTHLEKTADEEGDNTLSPEKLSKQIKLKTTLFGEYDTEYTSHGGIDVFDDEGDLHVATLTRVIDVQMGGTRYHLTYGLKEKNSSKFTYSVLRNDINLFYNTHYYGERNNIRIFYLNNVIHIYYISKNHDLIYANSLDNYTFYQIATDVEVFDAALNSNNELYLTYITESYYTSHIYLKKQGEASELIASKGSHQYNGASLNLLFSKNDPVITTKLYNSAEKTSMLHLFKYSSSWEEYILARGVDGYAQFNTYLDGDKIVTCHQDITYYFHKIEFDLITYELLKRKSIKYSYYTNCFVSNSNLIGFMTYRNNGSDYRSFNYLNQVSNLIDIYYYELPMSIFKIKNDGSSSWMLGHSSSYKRMVLVKANQI